MSKTIYCIKLKKDAEALETQPIPGEFGKKILENVSKSAWENWLGQQTMLINENRLDLSEASARKYLRMQMEQYFFMS